MLKRRSIILAAVVALCVAFFAPRSAGAATEITFWHAMTGTNAKVVTSLVADFNASQSAIHVTEQNKGSSYPDVLNAVLTASGAGQGPNIAQIFDQGTPKAIDSGFFVPVDSLLTADELAAVKADVLPAVLAYFTVNGKQYSMPWNNSTPLLYYNEDMFTAAGLDPAKPPATWADLEADCAKIMSSGAAPNCISMQVYGWFVEQWMALQGAELANNGNGRAGRATETNFTSDASKAIFTFWKDLADKKYWISSGKIEDGNGAKQIFNTKNAAMVIDSTGSLAGFVTSSQQAGFKLGTGWMPANDKVQRDGVIVGGASLWVGAGHPDDQNKAAAQFILWLLQPAQMAKWHQGTGYLPITLSSQKLLTDQGWFTQNPGAKTAIDQLNAVKSDSATAGAIMGPFPTIRNPMTDQTILDVTSGNVSIDDALTALKAKADQALADYNASLGATPAATAGS